MTEIKWGSGLPFLFDWHKSAPVPDLTGLDHHNMIGAELFDHLYAPMDIVYNCCASNRQICVWQPII